jgi:hypothetical protein
MPAIGFLLPVLPLLLLPLRPLALLFPPFAPLDDDVDDDCTPPPPNVHNPIFVKLVGFARLNERYNVRPEQLI